MRAVRRDDDSGGVVVEGVCEAAGGGEEEEFVVRPQCLVSHVRGFPPGHRLALAPRPLPLFFPPDRSCWVCEQVGSRPRVISGNLG